MAKIPETFNFGNIKETEELLRNLQEMYTQLAVAVNQKPDVYQRTTNGNVNETFLSNGDININLNTNRVEMLTNHPTQTTVTWTQLS
jgi:hypothetical protein